MFGRPRKDAPTADAADANATNTTAKTNTPTTPANPPEGEQAKADATSADGAAAGASTAAPNSPTGDKDINDRVEKRVREILAKERETEERTAAERAAHEAWIGRNAPKLAGNEMGRILFAGANTDDERKRRITIYRDFLKASGYKLPDQGSSPEREGGTVPWSDDNAVNERVNAANKAAELLSPRRL